MIKILIISDENVANAHVEKVEVVLFLKYHSGSAIIFIFQMNIEHRT